jgi:membrane associated rhomboid family serine protease
VEVLKTKLRRYVLLPTATALALTVAYSLLNRTLVAGGWLPLDDDLARYWLPGLMSFALVLTFVHPRLRELKLNEKRGVPFLYDLLATAAIAVPLALIQLYIAASAGQTAQLASAAEIAQNPSAKFFLLKTACFDRERMVVDSAIADDDDRGDVSSITFFVAIPACRSTEVWLGFKFRDTVSNRIDEAARKAKILAFARRTDESLAAQDFARYSYFERAGNNADHRALQRVLSRNGAPGTAVVLWPRATPFAGRGEEWLLWALGAAGVLWLAWLIAILIPPLRKPDDMPASAQPQSGPAFRNVLMPTRQDYGFALLIDANLLVYLAMVVAGLGVMSFATEDLADWGAVSRPLLHGPGLLRLISYQFVHGGLLHIANNMIGFLVGAMYLAPVARNARLILLYLLCGVGGGLASAWHSVSVTVGASGSIFGLYTILLVLYALKDPRIRQLGREVWSTAAIFVGLNLVFGFVSPSTDNAAHLGGTLTGLVLGLAIYLVDRPRRSA